MQKYFIDFSEEAILLGPFQIEQRLGNINPGSPAILDSLLGESQSNPYAGCNPTCFVVMQHSPGPLL